METSIYRTDVVEERVICSPEFQVTKRPLSRTATPRGFPKHTQMRLTSAKKLGTQETKNIINLFEKKEEEAFTKMSDTIEPKSTNVVVPSRDKNTRRRLKHYDEELNEEVLAVKNYDMDSITIQNSMNKICHRNPIQVNKCSSSYKPNVINIKSIENYGKDLSNITQKGTHLIHRRRIILHRDVSIQNSSIFSQSNRPIQRRKRSVEIQHSEKDINSKSSQIDQSEFPIQSNLETNFEHFDNEDEGDSLAKNEKEDLVYRTLETNARLKRIIKKLISNQRHQKLHHNWRRYINDLKNKHRPEDARLERLKLENRLFSSPSTRRVRSIFPLDGFCSQSFSAISQYKNKNKRDIDYVKIPRSVVDSHSYISYNVPKHPLIPSRSSSPSEYGSRRINPFCYPSICTNSFSCSRSSCPKYLRKGSRNIFSISNSEICNRILGEHRPRENAIDAESDYTNESPELLKDSSLATNLSRQRKNLPVAETRGQNQFNNESDALPSVPEESNNSLKMTSQSRRRQAASSLNKGEPTKKFEDSEKSASNQNNGFSRSSLGSIENKLDILIESIHAFMNEVKSSRSYAMKVEQKKHQVNELSNLDSKLIKYFKSNIKVNKTKSDPHGISTGDKILQSVGKLILANPNVEAKGTKSNKRNCEIKLILSSNMHTKSTNTFAVEPKIIVPEEHRTPKLKDKSNQNHQVTCNDYPHALQLTVDFLVKEPSNAHLPKSIDENIAEKENDCREIKPTELKSEQKVTTIVRKIEPGLIIDSSVNTDPLTLQQISKQTIEKLLSYFPLVNYYLSFLQMPQICPCKPKMFSCHICGRSFHKPSDLSDHIRTHNCGRIRDCVICRELLNSNNDTRSIKAIIPIPKLFTCQYCGQQFTRAYCKQLHELSCGEFRRKSVGKESSFVLLR